MNKRQMLVAGLLSGQPFEPKQIAGLAFWLDASALTLADNAALASWDDLSGNGNNISQSNAGYRPVCKTNIQNGRRVVRFAGGADGSRLTVSTHTIPTQGPITVYTVKSRDIIGTTGRKVLSFEIGATIGWAVGNEPNYSSTRFSRVGVQNLPGIGLSSDIGKFLVSTDVFSGSIWTNYINGSQRARETVAAGGNSNSGARAFWVGGNGATNEYWDGDLAEVLVYSGSHTDAQRAQVETYLCQKWGITKAPYLNPSTYLTTPTSDGSGQTVHPGVLYVPGGWHGHAYWMVHTPFANSSSVLENPEILCSDDGTTWSVPTGVTNPLVAAPAEGWNSDADIFMSADGVTMWLVYRHYLASNYDRIYVISSSDGWQTQSAPVLILSTAAGAAMSPTVLYDGSQYVMWIVAHATTPGVVTRYTCATPNGTWSAGTPVTYSNPVNNNPWHTCIRLTSGVYEMLMHEQSQGLFRLTSADGAAWTYDSNFNIAKPASGWDSTEIYRGTFVNMGAYWDIWYSAREGENSPNRVWHVGYTRYTIPA